MGALFAAMPARSEEIIFLGTFDGPPDCAPAGTNGCPGFAVETPSVSVSAGEQSTWCYYTHASNADKLAVGRLSVEFNAPIQYVVVYAGFDGSSGLPADPATPGTLAAGGCDAGPPGGISPYWLFAAHHTLASLDLPRDDGVGKPLAIGLATAQPLEIEMHVLNSGVTTVNAAVAVSMFGYAAGTTYTGTWPYSTLSPFVSLQPHSKSSLTYACNVPADARFWRFTTYTHKLATDATLLKLNGTATLVDTLAWDTPSIVEFTAPQFYQFDAADSLTVRCAYDNDTNSTVDYGPGDDDETCVGVGYFFPASRPWVCIDSYGVF